MQALDVQMNGPDVSGPHIGRAGVSGVTAQAVSALVSAGLAPHRAERLFAARLEVEQHPPGTVIAAEGRSPMTWLLDGWLCEARILERERRQIFSFAIPGDVVEAPLAPRSRTVVALTAVACVDVGELLGQTDDADEVHKAMRRVIALATARRYDHLARLWRRSAVGRLASLLVELHDRLDQVGLVKGDEFALPLRHEELADALGLSTVHVTRCFKILRERGLMTMKFRRISGFDRAELEKLED